MSRIAPHHHAKLLGFHHHQHALGVEIPRYRFRDLRCHALLQLGLSGDDLHQPRELAESRYPMLRGKIGDPRLPEKGTR